MKNALIYIVIGACLSVILTSFLSHDNIPETSRELGEKLFFEPMLSSDYSVSCGSCHKKEFGFADNTSLSLGVGGTPTDRNTPSAMYMNSRASFFWDGRAKTLEEQALIPLTNPNEMNMPVEEALKRLSESAFYRAAFRKVFNAEPTAENLSRSLADFQRSLQYYNSPYDRYLAGDESALSEAQLNGMSVFFFKGQCSTCHSGKDFSDDEMKNIGLFNYKEYNDLGRFAISKDSLDLGKFKTPHLRNITLTAPYMHDGSMETLREVIEYYNDPKAHVSGIVNMDSTMEITSPLELTEQEITDLESFMEALTDDQYNQ